MVLCEEQERKPEVRQPQCNGILRPRGPWEAQWPSADRMGAISCADHSSSSKGSGPLSWGWGHRSAGNSSGRHSSPRGTKEGQALLALVPQSLIAASQRSSRRCFSRATGTAGKSSPTVISSRTAATTGSAAMAWWPQRCRNAMDATKGRKLRLAVGSAVAQLKASFKPNQLEGHKVKRFLRSPDGDDQQATIGLSSCVIDQALGQATF